MNTDEHRYCVKGKGISPNDLTEMIIGCAFTVGNELGHGYLEKVYENALALEMRNRGLSVEQQYPVKVHYREQLVGDFIVDLLVEMTVVLELKAATTVCDFHLAQCLNYLRATRLNIGLLINFGTPRVTVKRFVL